MMENEQSDSLNTLKEELESLKNRVTHMEAILEQARRQGIISGGVYSPQKEALEDQDTDLASPASIEYRVGEYGMAWLGNIVLLFGITFLVQYLQSAGHLVFSTIIGLVSVAGVYGASHAIRGSYSYLSKLLAYNGHLLLFFIAIRLHFFQSDPLIGSKTAGIIVLCMVLASLFYLSYRRKSQLMNGMVLGMIILTGIISDSMLFSPLLITTAAFLSVFLYLRFGWIKLVFIFIFLVYLAHLNWLLNDPLIGNSPEFIKSPGSGYLFFIASGFLFSTLALIPRKEDISDDLVIGTVVWNGVNFTAILALITITYLSNNYIPVFSTIAAMCIGYSLLLQSRSPFKITASMYALYGFLAMSVAFYGMLLLPRAYLLLSLQSLLVVSMALWFGSRFIVVMNTILFILLLGFYLGGDGSSNATNFSFMLVALITARIINWKKERLKIKTELIRNLYLLFGFIMTLISFYHAFPPDYITVSWMGAAILFFGIGQLINNIKYRWLAIASLVASAIKLIFIDLSDIDIGFRVLVFLILAVILISVSILYTKYLIKKKE